MEPEPAEKKIAVLVVAYNHASTLACVLDRIPASVWDMVNEVMVFDDASEDETYRVGLDYRELRGAEKLTLIKNPANLGYGGNQKKGYRYCIERGYDIVVLLHGDGQYAPEVMLDLIGPLDRGEADAVFGSRMMEPGAARRGRMPLYKFIGNRILTAFENRVTGAALSEFHSGYRAYSVEALKGIPFESNTDDFHFDSEIIFQLVKKGCRIREVPIPTFYGDEICYVNGLKYAWNVFCAARAFRRCAKGTCADPRFNF